MCGAETITHKRTPVINVKEEKLHLQNSYYRQKAKKRRWNIMSEDRSVNEREKAVTQ